MHDSGEVAKLLPHILKAQSRMKRRPIKIGIVILVVVGLTFAARGCDNPVAVYVARKHNAALPMHGRIRSIRIHGDQAAADAVIPRLNGLRRLEAIQIGNVALTPDQLRVIGNQREVGFLSLIGCEITDDDLSHLSGLSNVRTLRLNDNAIKGEGLAHISGMQKLRTLYLGMNPIAGEGLGNLAANSELRTLRLPATELNDKGVENLLDIERLSYVDLNATRITAAGYLSLAELLWLRGIGYPDDLVGPDDDLDARMEARRELRDRFRQARDRAVAKAKADGRAYPNFVYYP